MHTSMIMYNACRWLSVGRSERCEKPCLNDFCGIHRAQLGRRPETEPMPCRKCGRGTKSETQLFSKPFHSDHAKKALHRAEAKARRLHPLSTASSPMRISVTRTTPVRKRSGRPSGARPWDTTATCTVAPTSCFWQMSLRRSGRCASDSTA